MENDTEKKEGTIAVICVNRAQFFEFIKNVRMRDRWKFVQVSRPMHLRDRKFTDAISLHFTDSPLYQQMLAWVKGERAIDLPMVQRIMQLRAEGRRYVPPRDPATRTPEEKEAEAIIRRAEYKKNAPKREARKLKKRLDACTDTKTEPVVVRRAVTKYGSRI